MTTEARDALATALARLLHDAMCRVSHHDGDGTQGPCFASFPHIAAYVAPRLPDALPDGWTLARREDAEDGAAREFRALVDEARASHVRWEHDAEVLEECLRSLCIGARVLLWPDPDAPRLSATAAARKATDAIGGGS